MPVRTPFGAPSDLYPGVYRGTIAVVDDPEKRKRYRVRVANIHPPEVERDHLPWAELGACFAGPNFGDIPGYEVDDPVWIAFEGGDRRFPVIMGGILNFEGGLPPAPDEQTGADYDQNQTKRWTRTTRTGIKVEMSDLEDELWVRLVTPDGSEVQVNGQEGTIFLLAEGRVNMVAPQVSVEAADSIVATTTTLTADVAERATLRCDDVVNVRAANRVNIGEYQPEQTGATLPIPEATAEIVNKATDLFQVDSGDLIDIDAGGAMQVDVIGQITINGQADIVVTGDANLALTVEGDVTADINGALTATVEGDTLLDIEGTTLIDSAQEITINGQADITVTAATTFDVQAGQTITIDGSADLTVNSALGMTFDAGLDLNLSAATQIVLGAPVITIDADTIAEMLAGATCRIDGGLNLIG